jgi:hypothetical protein
MNARKLSRGKTIEINTETFRSTLPPKIVLGTQKIGSS